MPTITRQELLSQRNWTPPETRLLTEVRREVSPDGSVTTIVYDLADVRRIERDRSIGKHKPTPTDRAVAAASNPATPLTALAKIAKAELYGRRNERIRKALLDNPALPDDLRGRLAVSQ